VGPCFGAKGRNSVVFMEIYRGGKNPKSGGKSWSTLPYFEMVDPHILTLKKWDRIEDVFHLLSSSW